MVKKLSDHRGIAAICSLAILFILGGFFWAFFALRTTGTDLLILHFNDINGITKIGGLGDIIFMGIFGIFVAVMNFLIALEFDARDPFLGKFLASMTLIFAILLFIAFAAIINVNV